MTKVRKNPNETNEQIVARMNTTLVGKPGIVMLTGEDRPMYVGNFVSAEMDVSLLMRFTNELVLFFTPIGIISVVEEKDGRGAHQGKFICDKLYIGDQTLGEVFADEVEEAPVAEAAAS